MSKQVENSARFATRVRAVASTPEGRELLVALLDPVPTSAPQSSGDSAVRAFRNNVLLDICSFAPEVYVRLVEIAAKSNTEIWRVQDDGE